MGKKLAGGPKLYDTALAALKSEDLRKAWDYAQALFKLENVFWSQKRYNELIQQIFFGKKRLAALARGERFGTGGSTAEVR